MILFKRLNDAHAHVRNAMRAILEPGDDGRSSVTVEAHIIDRQLELTIDGYRLTFRRARQMRSSVRQRRLTRVAAARWC
jgi:hypothetical protein